MIPSPCNITIGMATGGTVRSETVASLIGAIDVIKSHGVGTYLSLEIGGYAARNRNSLVERARQNGSNYLLFVDNDMVFPPSTFQRLLDADKDIVGVNYNARGAPSAHKPPISTVKIAGPDGQPIDQNTIPAQMFSCYGVGTGLMLIKMGVFDKLKKPYFIAWESEDGEHHTEDIEFCKNARAQGYEVYCNPTIKVGHIGSYEY